MCAVSNDNHEEYIEERYKIFVLYFEGLDRINVPYGMTELTKKAKELGLPVPSREELRLWKEKYLKE